MADPARPAPIAVGIVSYDSAGELPGCLASLGELDPPPAEVVVVDCASGDGSAELAEREAPAGLPLQVVRLPGNLGFAGGFNRAAAATRSPYLLSLNPDARIGGAFLSRLLTAFERWPGRRVAAATGRLLRPGDPPRRLDACGMRLTLTWRHLDRGSGRVDRGQYGERERVFGGTGAVTLFLREALEDVAVDGDLLLPEFHSFREDAELAFRLRERGWEVVYEPAAEAVHRRLTAPGRRRSLPPAVNYHSVKNRYLLRAYHQTRSNLLMTLIPTLWRDALALGYVVLRERTSLPAYRWLWRNRRAILERSRRIRGRRRAGVWEVERWFFRRGIGR